MYMPKYKNVTHPARLHLDPSYKLPLDRSRCGRASALRLLGTTMLSTGVDKRRAFHCMRNVEPTAMHRSTRKHRRRVYLNFRKQRIIREDLAKVARDMYTLHYNAAKLKIEYSNR